MTLSLRALFGALAATVAAVVVVAGLMVMGPPGEARLRRLDTRRADDLRQTANAVDLYWQRHKTLPASLTDAAKDAGWQPASDPSSGKPYAYRVLGGKQYELCATFERASDAPPSSSADPFWSHSSGHQCFSLEARDRPVR